MINVNDNYWVVGGSTTEVYQSKTNIMVPMNDAGYTGAKKAATPIASVEELSDVLRANGSQLPEWLLATQPTFIQPSPGAYTNEQLASYSASARYDHATAGIIVASLNATVPFLTDPVSRNTVNSAWDYMNSKGTTNTVQWKMSNGSFVTLTTTQMNTLMSSISLFVQACFDCESSTLSSIASGAVTTLAQIDAAYAAVSNVYP
jgi:hypothetical protein